MGASPPSPRSPSPPPAPAPTSRTLHHRGGKLPCTGTGTQATTDDDTTGNIPGPPQGGAELPGIAEWLRLLRVAGNSLFALNIFGWSAVTE